MNVFSESDFFDMGVTVDLIFLHFQGKSILLVMGFAVSGIMVVVGLATIFTFSGSGFGLGKR